MKRKIGELRNIPIVEGDKNLVREGTEIHINDLQSKGSSGSGSSGKEEYYYFRGPVFMDDFNLKKDSESNNSEEMETLRAYINMLSPTHIVKRTGVGQNTTYFETKYTGISVFDFYNDIYLKFNENEYSRSPIGADGNTVRMLVFKGTFEQKITDVDMLASLDGSFTIKKYFEPVTKEEYYDTISPSIEYTANDIIQEMN